jgi:hypothetical protein
MRSNTTLNWSWVRGCRFEGIALLVVVMLLAAGSAGAIGTFVGAYLFGPIHYALSLIPAA